MHRIVLDCSVAIVIAAGTAGTVFVDVGLFDATEIALPLFLAGLGGIVAAAMKVRA